MQVENHEDNLLKFYSFIQTCIVHGSEFIDYKCRFCCSIASYRCGGPTSYCTMCHDGKNPNRGKQCPGVDKCPLKIQHAPNGCNFINKNLHKIYIYI